MYGEYLHDLIIIIHDLCYQGTAMHVEEMFIYFTTLMGYNMSDIIY
jgi:hypothetical protein